MTKIEWQKTNNSDNKDCEKVILFAESNNLIYNIAYNKHMEFYKLLVEDDQMERLVYSSIRKTLKEIIELADKYNEEKIFIQL